ncbi:hypothetical protein Q0Z83_002890 [Actinoplanes sichuanensis]|nr:hypothetical protein Q0Z83_002890 [Actinoplanes sichuanensis]
MSDMTWLKKLVCSVYARRLRKRLDGAELPRHLAMVMDGNRRWARQMGFEDARVGHRYGAEHLDEVLGASTWRAGSRCFRIPPGTLSSRPRSPPGTAKAAFI